MMILAEEADEMDDQGPSLANLVTLKFNIKMKIPQ